MIKTLKYVLLGFLIVVFGAVSCRKSAQQIDRTNSNLMYAEIKQLLLAWTDSLNYASDSVSIANVIATFEEKLVKINFAYPPETDANMTYGQQDTILKLTTRFVRLKRQKENNVFNRDSIVLITDTLP